MRVVVRMAHPVSPVPGEDWPEPSRWRRLQYPAAVAAYCFLLAVLLFGIAALGMLAGTALGLDMAVPR